MDLERAVPLGMIVNELAMNSVKHGFPEGKPSVGDESECEITVSLRRDGGSYTLVFQDNGCGLVPDFDWMETETMGLHLIRMLGGHQLQGAMRLDGTHGTTFTLCFGANEPERS
jgi:two-component sensor histidine kinase